MSFEAHTWASARSILCIRLDTLGDVVMTTPAIRAIKQAPSRPRVTLLTSPRGAPVAGLVPEIDRVWTYDAPWMKATPPRSDSQPDMDFITQLRSARYDAAVIFTTFSQSPLPAALLCYLAGIPLRLAHCHENPYQLLTNWVKDEEPQNGVRHEVQRQLDLVKAIGYTTPDDRLSLRVPDEARKLIKRRLAQLPIDLSRPWVVIHPGASASSRRYPPLNFALAARELIRTYGWQVVLTGAEHERNVVQSIQAMLRAPSQSLAGELDIAQLAALIDLAPLFIVNNTGPAHIAAALGTPLVDLYALTNPQHTPWRANCRVLSHPVPCQNCFKSVCPEGHQNCLRLIPPTAVVAAALDLFDGTRLQSNGLAAAASPSAPSREEPSELRRQPKAEVEWWVESEALAT